jgi:hypothetical protein
MPPINNLFEKLLPCSFEIEFFKQERKRNISSKNIGFKKAMAK